VVRIFKTKIFARFARKADLSEDALREAVACVERGLIDADLGGGVIKQRVARPGQGKSGGFRTVVLYRLRMRAIFVYGFEKSDRDNIDDNELLDFKKLAQDYLNASDNIIAQFVKDGRLVEVENDDKTLS
jgi:hypothetical protein